MTIPKNPTRFFSSESPFLGGCILCVGCYLLRHTYILQNQVMGYYPLHFLVSTLGAPMFIATDRLMNNSWGTTGMHAFLNYSLLQAWFPSEAEIWNPPTWFLSALSFANFTMPAILPQIARLSKDGLQKLLVVLSTLSLLQKLSYSQAWKFYCCGGFTEKTAHPYLWNVTRFHPFGALVEIVTGATAARTVMLDEEKQKPMMNPLWLFLASYASLGLRLTTLNLNDAMIRTLLFMPLYTKFLTEMHRTLAVKPKGSFPMIPTYLVLSRNLKSQSQVTT